MIALVEKPVEKPVANGAAPVVEPVPIEKLKQTVSASRLNCWLQCRLKFYFRYVLKITKPKTAALHFGSVVHLVLQQWNLDRWRRQPFEITKLKQVFETGWLDQGTINWEGEETDQKNTAWNVLEKYFTDTPIKANEMPEAVEVPVEADLGKHGLPVLIGVLDLVRSGGRIVDFKTAGKTPACNSTATRCSIVRPLANARQVGNCIIWSKPRCRSWSSPRSNRCWNISATVCIG